LLAVAVLGTLAVAAPGRAAETQKVKLYFTTGEQFRTVERDIVPGSKVFRTIDALLAGPTKAEKAKGFDTQIPKGVTVDSFTYTTKHVILLDISAGLLDGVPADPAQRTRDQTQLLRARLAQLIYTVTQFGDVKAAKVRVGGKVIDADLRRADYVRPRAPATLIGPTKPQGPASDATTAVQQQLARLRFLPADAVDGKLGYRTTQAITAFQAWNGLTRDGVAGPLTTTALNNAQPPRPTAGGAAKRIEVYRDKGVALFIADNKLVRAIHVSTGAGANATPAGRYSVFRKELRSWSIPFKVFLPYASYFNNGIAFHEYPDVPPYPASHGCVRVGSPEAPGVYRFAKLGTAVIVV
jgi:lipoprotein-anchoring transpeptidase ErfK/SrfK